ncbi:hypothetical protein [Chryseobacterium potabilaquae]|uniref:Uncharacterized protein n=1 Tax=Chryseobacterium potabilaquae TaxID=2675057 RepID=A0A6N4XAE0_9FLAO|nr:hypothetical protein [Chryseobacterium potabilaquae]CAA7197270.1 hypothetical protein CHRY9293_03323 [Chryseobacterium potabilaquae]
MKNTVIYITCFIFITYWSITLFFTFPENPINVKNLKVRQCFDNFFYQQWSFFAPPATFNDRLYFSYIYHDPITNNKKVRTFEALATITKEKREKAPFNKTQDVLDYIISGSVHDTQNNVKEIYDMINAQDKRTGATTPSDEKSKKVIEVIEKTESFSNLLNYAKIIAKNNRIPENNTECKITITNLAIPKFVNKNSLDKKEEQTIFSSHLHPLKLTK